MAKATKLLLAQAIIISALVTAISAGWITFRVRLTADPQEQGVKAHGGDEHRIHSQWLDPTIDEFSINEVSGQYRTIKRDSRQQITVSIRPNNDLEVQIAAGYGSPARTEIYTFIPDGLATIITDRHPELGHLLEWSGGIKDGQEQIILAWRHFDWKNHSKVWIASIKSEMTLESIKNREFQEQEGAKDRFIKDQVRMIQRTALSPFERGFKRGLEQGMAGILGSTPEAWLASR